MKNLLIISAAVFALSACSSKPKDAMTGAATDATSAASDAMAKGKDAMDKGKDAMMDKTATKDAMAGQAASTGSMLSLIHI